MSDASYILDPELQAKLLKIVNLQLDTQLKVAQRAFLPWRFMMSIAALAFTAGAGLMAAVFILARWKVRG